MRSIVTGTGSGSSPRTPIASWYRGTIHSLIRALAAALVLMTTAAFAESQKEEPQQIDASDPTRIVTFIGAGPKTTRYTDGSRINEARVTATIGLGAKDMIIAGAGYGRNTADKENGLTNMQIRHFHLFEMDNTIKKGYRGWGSSIEINLAGSLRGMDGQNLVAVGASPAFALGNDWQLYPIVMMVNSWDKRFGQYNGGGVNLSPMLAKTLDWWDGAFVTFWPQYNRFFWGNLDGEGGGQLQVTLGGRFTPTLIWRLQGFTMFNKYFQGYKNEIGFAPRPQYSAFFRLESYF